MPFHLIRIIKFTLHFHSHYLAGIGKQYIYFRDRTACFIEDRYTPVWTDKAVFGKLFPQPRRDQRLYQLAQRPVKPADIFARFRNYALGLRKHGPHFLKTQGLALLRRFFRRHLRHNFASNISVLVILPQIVISYQVIMTILQSKISLFTAFQMKKGCRRRKR
jgi:hypothetical protein